MIRHIRFRRLLSLNALAVAGLLLFSSSARADEGGRWLRVLLLHDYNTRIVLFGSTILGICLGVVGVIMLLRRRSLMGDVVSHASLPGIALAFLVLEAFSPGSGKFLPGLLAGATLFGVLGVLAVITIRRGTRIKEDAALAIVLSVFFGAGVVLISIIQSLPSGNAAGLHQFIYGQAASMVASDVWLIVITSAISLILLLGLFKELRLLCFDEKYGKSMGWPTLTLDLLVMGLVVVMSVVGIQSVGLLLVVAMLIIPASAARFWSDSLGPMTFAAACLGGLSAYGGVATSAMAPNLAAGAVIVLAGAVLFVVSLLIGPKRGVLQRLWSFRQLKLRMENQHLLRAAFEHLETTRLSDDSFDLKQSFAIESLKPYRAWSEKAIGGILQRCQGSGWTEPAESGWRLTDRGAAESRRLVRNHRLWELYLIEYADIAPSHVDRDADDIEHVLGPEIVADLERLFEAEHGEMPTSPHEIAP